MLVEPFYNLSRERSFFGYLIYLLTKNNEENGREKKIQCTSTEHRRHGGDFGKRGLGLLKP